MESMGTSGGGTAAPTATSGAAAPTTGGEGQSQSQIGTPSNGQSGQNNTPSGPNASGQGGDQGQGDPGGNQPEPKVLGQDMFDALVETKINGKTVKKSVAEIIADAQKAAAADEKFRTAAETRKKNQQFEQLLGMFGSEDLSAFAENYKNATGKEINLEDWAETLVAQKFERMQMTPEQRELADLKAADAKRAKAIEDQRNSILSEIQDLMGSDMPEQLKQLPPENLKMYLQQVQTKFQEAEAALDKAVVEAWQKSGLPKHPYFGSLMTYQMINHEKTTGEALQPAEAAAKVKENFFKFGQEVANELDAKAIHEWLGPNVIKKLRDYDIETVNGGNNAPPMNQRPTNSAANQQNRNEPMNESEWRKFMGLD